MKCKELVLKIDEKYPVDAALSWDNVGFLVGCTQQEVKRIFVALDLTDEVVETAIKEQVDMIVTHHPMLFSTQKKITDETVLGRRLIRLIQNDISCYAAHTNYDVLGMAELAGSKLGLLDAVVLEETGWEKEGIGRVGFLPQEMTLGECCEWVKEKFHLPSVKLFGNMETRVRRAAISPGSGKSMIDVALEKKAEVLITGDIDHHTGIDAVAEGLGIIDAGHYGLEYIFVQDMTTFLREHTDAEVIAAKTVFPFQNV